MGILNWLRGRISRFISTATLPSMFIRLRRSATVAGPVRTITHPTCRCRLLLRGQAASAAAEETARLARQMAQRQRQMQRCVRAARMIAIAIIIAVIIPQQIQPGAGADLHQPAQVHHPDALVIERAQPRKDAALVSDVVLVSARRDVAHLICGAGGGCHCADS